MKYYINILMLFVFTLTSCKQNISLKKNKLTGLNPVAFTDVVFKSQQDTVYVSTFDGKIYQIVRKHSDQKQIVSLDDEIYDLAYDTKKHQIYAATLSSGVLVIDVKTAAIIKKLPLKENWAYQITYNERNGILATFDFGGNPYAWDSTDDFEILNIPKTLNQMRPRYISDEGNIYFDGQNGIVVWNYKTGKEVKSNEGRGRLVDVDFNGNFLLIADKEFAFYNSKSDSIQFRKKHPNWPIYSSEKDSTVYVPLSRNLISGLLTRENIYTIGLDKTLRKWDKNTGNLSDTFLSHKGSISAMAINKDKNQMVTVDLLGGIEFWNL